MVSRFLVSAALVLLGYASSVFPKTPNPYVFSSDVEITEAPTTDGSSLGMVSSGGHYVAFLGDTVYAVWQESRDFTAPVGTGIFFAKSTDGGQTFGPNVVAAGGVNPSMRVDTAGIIYLVYQSSADIFFRKSTDGGTTFSSRVKVNDDTIPQIGQIDPAIAVNNKGHIFVVWRDQRTAPGQPHRAVFAAASYDTGRTFTPNAQVNEVGTIASGGIDIGADDSGHVFVAYRGTTGGLFGIVFGHSDDSGQSYAYHSLASDLPTGAGSTFAEDPSIAVSTQGLISAVWQDGRFNQFTLRFSHSTDFGQTFSPSVIIDGSGFPQFPSLVWNSDTFNVAWRAKHPRPSDTSLTDHIFFSYSSDTGKSFKPFVWVNNDLPLYPPDQPPTAHLIPSIAANKKSGVFIAWVDDRYDPFFMEQYHIFGAAGKPNFLKGDLNLDLLLTPLDVVQLLNAAFLNAPFPAPFQNADINCDGMLSPLDVVLELQVVFVGEQFPCP